MQNEPLLAFLKAILVFFIDSRRKVIKRLEDPDQQKIVQKLTFLFFLFLHSPRGKIQDIAKTKALTAGS